MDTRVVALNTTPVKGMRLRGRHELMLERAGVAHNRRFYVIDEMGRMVNGKRIGALAGVVADYDLTTGRLSMTFPSGKVVDGEVVAGETVETRFLSQTVDAQLVEGPWDAGLSDYAGRELRLVQVDPRRGGTDRGSRGGVSLIGRASIDRLEYFAGTSVDPRRFRMLIEVEGPAAHEEDGWVGCRLRVGAATVQMHGHVGRCLVTGQDPDTGTADLPTLELLRRYRQEVQTTEPLAFGIFGEVVEPGVVRLGDEVTLQ